MIARPDCRARPAECPVLDRSKTGSALRDHRSPGSSQAQPGQAFAGLAEGLQAKVRQDPGLWRPPHKARQVIELKRGVQWQNE